MFLHMVYSHIIMFIKYYHIQAYFRHSAKICVIGFTLTKMLVQFSRYHNCYKSVKRTNKIQNGHNQSGGGGAKHPIDFAPLLKCQNRSTLVVIL